MILYFHTGKSSFVDKDIAILREINTVKTFAFTVDRKWKTPLIFIKQLFFLTSNVLSCRLMVSQFAGYHSFLPGLFCRLTGKKLLIIAGGTDCVSYPNIGYGNFYRKLLRIFTGLSYRLCHHISPKHDTLRVCDYDYDETAPGQQGILAFLPHLKKEFTSIPNGYDTAFWTCKSPERKQGTFITVSGGFEFPFQTRLKGIDLILETAPDFPQYDFTIVGVPEHIKLPIRSANIRVLPPTDANGLRTLYCSHQFYLQLSMAEGFPNALSEAMLCGCVPIGSSVFSIPEIIGKNGLILKKRDTAALKALIRNIPFSIVGELGLKASESIRERFPIDHRRTLLLRLAKGMMTANR